MFDLRRLKHPTVFLQDVLEEFRDKWKSEVRVRKDEDNGNEASGGPVTDVDRDIDVVTKVLRA